MKIQIKQLVFSLLIGMLSLIWLATAEAAEVMVTDAYAREMPPGVVNSAVYLTLKNTSNHSVVLTHVTSGRAGRVLIHQNMQQGDMMRMRPVPQLQIAAHSQFNFTPGGHHLMVMDLSQPLQVGQELDLTFQFEEGPVIEITVPVIGSGGGSEGQRMQMGMDIKGETISVEIMPINATPA